MGWWIALGILLLIGCLPVGVHLQYDESGPQVKIVVGVFRIPVFPREKSEKKPKKVAPKRKKARSPAKPAQPAAKKTSGNLKDFLPLLRRLWELMVEFRNALRINRLELKLCLAGEDPYNLAMCYSRIWAAMGVLDAQLERLFRIRKKRLLVDCDFLGSDIHAEGVLELTVTPGRLLWLTIRQSFRILPEVYKILSIRKGGATQ